MNIKPVSINQTGASPFLRRTEGNVKPEVQTDSVQVENKSKETNASKLKELAMKTSQPKKPWRAWQKPAQLKEVGLDGKYKISNIRWGFEKPLDTEKPGPVFKDTTIDPTKVKDVYFMLEPFDPEWVAAHTLMGFEFEDGGMVSEDGRQDNRLVVSVEARLREGESYGLVKGLAAKNPNVYQLGTWKDSIQYRSQRQGHKMVRYKLNLTKDQKEQLLKNSLKTATEDHSKDMYHTVKNNCFNSQLRLLNSVLPEEQKITEWAIPGMLFNPYAAVPKLGPALLDRRGLLEGKAVYTQPNKEMHPEEQKEKSKLGNIFRKIVNTGAWHVMPAITGTLAGAALGTLVMPPVVGTMVGGLAGGFSASRAGGSIRRTVNFETEPSEKYLK
ncbi:MAG: DUF4105 domain-containing protein [Vulcanimicrobiota bacterium]